MIHRVVITASLSLSLFPCFPDPGLPLFFAFFISDLKVHVQVTKAIDELIKYSPHSFRIATNTFMTNMTPLI